MDHNHKEAYGTYVGHPVNAPDQGFLIEKVKGEVVTELTIPVHNIVTLLEKIHVDCMKLFSLAAPFLVTVVHQKEAPRSAGEG